MALPPTLSQAGLVQPAAADLGQLFRLHFMVNAFEAGTIVAVIAGAVGWFMVLRRQSFAGHTLAVVSFPGRRGHLARAQRHSRLLRRQHRGGVGHCSRPRSSSGRPRSQESAVIGTVQAFALARACSS